MLLTYILATACGSFFRVFVASTEDRYDIANVLLRHGAKVNAVDNHGQTALTLAVYNGFAGLVGALLQMNADINVKNAVQPGFYLSKKSWGVRAKPCGRSRGRTCLRYICIYNYLVSIKRYN